MNLKELEEKFSGIGVKHHIDVHCSECGEENTIRKENVIRNITQNGCYICRKCRMLEANKDRNWTDEGKARIAAATSYKRSDETKAKMSEAKLAFYQTPEGKALKKKLSLLAAQGHAENKFENTKRQGWYESQKSGKQFYGSSYELRLLVELDADDDVEEFQTQVPYRWSGRGRCLDCLVTYTDGSQKAIEVKPESRMNEQANIDQVNDSYAYAHEEGWDFELCTESSFGMTEKELRDWADEFRSTLGDFDWVAFRKEQSRKRAKKHYQEKISKKKVKFHCEYCDKEHEVLAVTYRKNIKKNGRFICHKENADKPKPRKKKENPYAAEGKKQCTKCSEIKPFGAFGLDKSRVDGYASRCKECRK
jgi:hypothetical protein